MNDEEADPEKLANIAVGGDISMLSIGELQERIILLEQEIGRLKTDISAKKISKAAAESIFRS